MAHTTFTSISALPGAEQRERAEQAPADSAREHDNEADTSRCVYCKQPAATVRTGRQGNRFGLCGTCGPQHVASVAVEDAIRTRLAGLTTNPRDVAEQLHAAIDDAQAEHLARPEVGGFPLDEARGHEAFSTAVSAMTRSLMLSANPKLTAEGLRAALDMVIREAGA